MKYNIKTIYLAGGCFWEVEAYISRLNGVIQTETGYANGITHDPTYEKVAAGKTKHVECVKVNYNTYETTLEEILKEFLKIIKKPAKPQHKLGIYWHESKDAKTVLKFLKQSEPKLPVEANFLRGFYLAEEKYQKYLDKHPEINSDIEIKMNPSDNLTLLSYQVTKLAMNEEAFSGKYADFDEEGVYVDITNNEKLFSSKDKIKTNSGYACFSKAIDENAIDNLRDFSYGMVKLETRASKSGIHLGYKRKGHYEINSAALKFIYK